MSVMQELSLRGTVLVVLALFLLSTAGLSGGEKPTNELGKDLGREGRIVHAPIHIDGNTDFGHQASLNGWPGDGTQANPYIIEGYEINAWHPGYSGTYCIWIENTTVYFLIRNCYVFNATNTSSAPFGSGIALNNVRNGTITNNNASGNAYGILLYFSSNYNNITNNNASGNSYFGIELFSSSNNNITSNNASGNSLYGIYLDYLSNNNTITYNWLCHNIHHGVYITTNSTGNKIQHNNFIANNGAGKGHIGNSQAYDSVGGNFWYDNTTKEGNYWSNWDWSGWSTPNAYPIDGGVGASDWYPLSRPILMPLHIIGNGNFSSYARFYGWAGDGSQANPYIIEGYDINGNGGRYCIWIENTTAYFVIRNCNVHGTTGSWYLPYGSGIALTNVEHGTITNNNASGNAYGIVLYSSSINSITNNNASSNSDTGIYLWGSSNNTITNNTVSGNYYEGIYLKFSSNNNSIINNNASGNSNGGIHLDLYNHYNTILNNNVSGNSFGIVIGGSNYNNITGNIAYHNSASGISVSSSSNNTIMFNRAFYNTLDGIKLSCSSNNTITNNNASGNSYNGIRLLFSSNNTIANNTASGNSWDGIYLGYSAYNTITNNNASGNSWDGISLFEAYENHITSNNFIANSRAGVFLNSSSNNTITGNNVSENYYIGIFLDSSSNNIITYNWLCNNKNYGVNVTNSSQGNIIHHNNFIANNGASKGVSGNCQAYDDSGGNSWYDATAREGNYWSNWDGNGWGTASAYPIDGGMASDYYPVTGPVVAEISGSPVALLVFAVFLAFMLFRKRK